MFVFHLGRCVCYLWIVGNIRHDIDDWSFWTFAGSRSTLWTFIIFWAIGCLLPSIFAHLCAQWRTVFHLFSFMNSLVSFFWSLPTQCKMQSSIPRHLFTLRQEQTTLIVRQKEFSFLGKKTFSNPLFWNLYRVIIIIIERSGGSSILFFTFDNTNYHFIQSVFGHNWCPTPSHKITYWPTHYNNQD